MNKRGYRLSVDDNIWFLRNIAQHPEYTSIFDDPYMKLYKKIHDTYGTKVHFNLFYATDGFDLSQMPDRFKEEWAANADWICLSFHSKTEFPEWPYLTAGYEQVQEEFLQVRDEILRFAGPEVYGPVTTIHFAELTKEGTKALRDNGILALLGDFSYDAKGERWLDYYCTAEQFDTVREKCFYKDPETDMIFCCCDIVLNTFKPEEIAPEMDRMAKAWPDRDFVDILIHEQYFYEDYKNYLPYYGELLEEGVKWCIAAGYEPAFVAEMVDLENFE